MLLALSPTLLAALKRSCESPPGASTNLPASLDVALERLIIHSMRFQMWGHITFGCSR